MRHFQRLSPRHAYQLRGDTFQLPRQILKTRLPLPNLGPSTAVALILHLWKVLPWRMGQAIELQRAVGELAAIEG
ncbi:hypothetical protein D3C80_2116840 [compost metagenome]